MNKTIWTPVQVRYRLCRIFARDFEELTDPDLPSALGIAAKILSEKYEEDYQRCLDICEMIKGDEKILNIEEGESDE